MKGSLDPGLEIVELQVNQRKKLASLLGIAQGHRLVLETFARGIVARPAIGDDVGPWRNIVLEKRGEVLRGSGGYKSGLGVASHEAAALDSWHFAWGRKFALYGHHYQHLVLIAQAPATALRGALSAVIGLIDLYYALKEMLTLTGQRSAQFVEHGPGGGIAKALFPTEMGSRNSSPVLSHQVSRPEPFDQGQLGPVQDSTGSHRFLESTAGALENTGLHLELIGSLASALLAFVPTWQTNRGQILDARLLGAESLLEANQGRFPATPRHSHPSNMLYASQ
jgi:hypothetical protein